MTRSRKAAIILAAVAIAVFSTTSAANAKKSKKELPKPRYTNATNVKIACDVHWNYPHTGVPDLTWPAGPATGSKEVGVRYTAGGYALVLDYSRAPDKKHKRAGQFPWWGWISQDCLVDPVARHFPRGTTQKQDRRDRPDPDSFAPPLLNRTAVGGDDQTKWVDLSPERGEAVKKTIHLGSGGTLRSGPKQFAIGNLHEGWEFQITRTHCRTESGQPFKPTQWVYGYAPTVKRWGWVQADHLPACTTP